MSALFSRNTSSKHPLTSERKQQLRELCRILKIRVWSLSLLDRALTHTSYLTKNNREVQSYERLEFLGDSILNASASLMLYREEPAYKEGRMSALRSSLVDERTLSEISQELGIDRYINLGKGERLSDQRARRKVSADVVESIIGVLYLDRGFEYARRFVDRLIYPLFLSRLERGLRDHKSKLQRISLEKYKKYPEYRVLKESGPDHNKIFEVQVCLDTYYCEVGQARSKKEAEQQAAKKALSVLQVK